MPNLPALKEFKNVDFVLVERAGEWSTALRQPVSSLFADLHAVDADQAFVSHLSYYACYPFRSDPEG